MEPAADRPLPFRRRPEVELTLLEVGDSTEYVAYDPLTLRYYRLSAAQAAILEELDGRVTLQADVSAVIEDDRGLPTLQRQLNAIMQFAGTQTKIER